MNNQLCISVYRGFYDEVVYRIEKEGCDVNSPSTDDPNNIEYPITIACKAGNTKMVKYLLNRGANPNVTDGYNYDDWTPLIIASRLGHYDIVKLLLKHGAENTPDWDRRYPERFARRYGHVKIVELLEEHF